MFRSLLLSAFLLVLLPACGGDSTTTGDGGPSGSGSGGGATGVVGGLPGEVEPPEGASVKAQPPAEGELPAPEFKGARTAIQPVTESSSATGTKMAGHVSTAEQAVLLGDSAKADEQILAAVSAMAKDPKIKSNMRRDVLAALAADLAAVKDYEGKPTVTIIEHKDRCCAEDGSCSMEVPTATCWEVKQGDVARGCGGECEEARPEGEDTDAGIKAEEVDGKGDDDDSAGADAAPEAAAPAAESAPAADEAGEAKEGEEPAKTE
ncbi:MAG: hypothetical protein GY898_12250 [Proteobacteria bacterium]|nr:hypothetical protein [Pseudomonadota bacterium]